MAKYCVQFAQLPGLSNEQPNVQNGSTPEAKGYGTYWYKVENIEGHGGRIVSTFLILFVFMFKLIFVFFSYELYQKLIKQKLYEKTHDRYYTYWSAQVLIFGGLIGLGMFAIMFQKNEVALKTFWSSVGVDLAVAMMITFIVMLKIYPCRQCLKNDEGQAEQNAEQNAERNPQENPDQDEDDTKFIPPPLLVCWQCFECCQRCPCTEHCLRSTKKVVIILVNGGSLFLFLAIGSYVAQAVPAIAISYYVNPTSTLIRLGFFELIVVVLMVEISYLIFLYDKLSWLCYITSKKELPDELSNETNFICAYVNECKIEQNGPAAKKRNANAGPAGQTETDMGGPEPEGDTAPLLGSSGHDITNYGSTNNTGGNNAATVESSITAATGEGGSTTATVESSSTAATGEGGNTTATGGEGGSTTATVESSSTATTGEGGNTTATGGEGGITTATGEGGNTTATGGEGGITTATGGEGGNTTATGGEGGITAATGEGGITTATGGEGGNTTATGGEGGITTATGGEGGSTAATGGEGGNTTATGGEGGITTATGGEGGSTAATGGEGGSTAATGEGGNNTQQKKYSCRWYWLCIVFSQIVALLFVITISAPALYFLMQIVIDQTSSSNNDFKDLLTIIPTIALNAWLLLKHGDITHAMKEIMKSAIKERKASEGSKV